MSINLNATRSELEALTKDELINKLLDLNCVSSCTEKVVETNDSSPNKRSLDNESSSIPTTKKDKKGKRPEKRPFDMSKYAQRQIALDFAYIGWNYMGVASQGDQSTALSLEKLGTKDGLKIVDPTDSSSRIVATVEDYLYKALLSCKLIIDPNDCNFSRCGRTDKGVSGLSQVVSIRLRSSLSQEILDNSELEFEGELPYADMINKSLPEDIRVLSWAPVQSDFNARFDCRSRSYKYFFLKDGTNLNIDLMQEACQYLVGSNDYRNFCRQDGSKQITEFTRDIFEARIQKADFWYPSEYDISQSGSAHPMKNCESYELFVRGSGFLWHQIRCIMGILFLVGQGLEEPTIVKKLLDVGNLNEKPVYELASPYPLVLYDCSYDKELKWQSGSDMSLIASARTFRSVYSLWYENLTRAYHYANILNKMKRITPGGTKSLEALDIAMTPLVMGGGRRIATRNYIPVLDRPRAPTVESRNQKYREKKQRQQSKNESK